MRGAPKTVYRETHIIGIIPADAGSTMEGTEVGVTDGDHPRGCGEHRMRISSSVHRSGSSPRMRGAPRPDEYLNNALGIIPADAGSTRPAHCLPLYRQDHPRGCGEHESGFSPPWPRAGSSPRMRGALCPIPLKIALIRIIPADAGSTSVDDGYIRSLEDHPRGCGEHLEAYCAIQIPVGSSPRMRGAPILTRCSCRSTRIIPADAGSTLGGIYLMMGMEDHPRGCGEHHHAMIAAFNSPGSSPRMRGAPQALLYATQRGRIIPADAGSTVIKVSPLVDCQDHPRGCGEHLRGLHDAWRP